MVLGRSIVPCPFPVPQQHGYRSRIRSQPVVDRATFGHSLRLDELAIACWGVFAFRPDGMVGSSPHRLVLRYPISPEIKAEHLGSRRDEWFRMGL